MARSLSLNPASTPFFPGGSAFGDDDLHGPIPHTRSPPRDSGAPAASQPTSGPPDYRTFHSSPSPTSDLLDRSGSNADTASSARFPADNADPRTSPTIRQVRADRAYPGVEMHVRREMSLAGSIETLPEEPQPISAGASINLMNEALRPRTGSSSRREPFLGGILNRSRENLGYQAGPVLGGSRTASFNTAPSTVLSASPVSSVESMSQAASSADQALSFESQLQSSPIILDILERLVSCEFSTRAIQRDLGDVHRKIDLLLERSAAPNSTAPQFNDPFAPSSAANGMGPRASFSANIAPNQPDPANDIGAINQRLSTLTSSVGQLLALQTQNMQIASNAVSGSSNVLAGRKVPGAEVTSNGPFANGQTPMFVTRGISQTRGASTTRGGNPPLPVRNWSVGNLEAPLRALDTSNLGSLRGGKNLVEDRRSSVMGLMRRDSIAPVDNWSTGQAASTVPGTGPAPAPRADGTGPTLTKWDQLPLSPELLHSLAKFGVGPPNKIQQRALPFLLRGADIIAQAPPTQERIAAYVIPAIQVVLTQINARPVVRGPIVVMVSTTVDQATQAQRMIRDLGGPIGVRSALGVGIASGDIGPELRLLQQNVPHIICGTPQKLHAIFTSPGGLSGAEVRFLVLDEVDQLIARNLHEFVFNIVKLFPSPRARPLNAPGTASSSSFDSNGASTAAAFNPTPGRKFSTAGLPPSDGTTEAERQTALFSNTVPQDVLNLANTIQLREPVRVLVRRDGTVTQTDTAQGARGLRQFYLYLALTAGGRPEPSTGSGSGLGIIGSGRGATSAETSQAREWKLDALADLFEDVDIPHAIVHVGGMAALEAVVYKLQTRNVDAVALHGDMAPAARITAINRFRSTTPLAVRTKALVIYDVQVKSTEVSQIPLVINYDLPKAVEEYAHRVAPAIASNFNRAGVVINFVTATGGDVEMLRSIECFYKIKCPEVPVSIRDIL